MKNLIYVLILLFCFSGKSNSQLYQGPAQGSITGGVIVSTNDFGDDFSGMPLPNSVIVKNKNDYTPELFPDYINKIRPTAPEGSNFDFDESTLNTEFDSPSILIKNFPGTPRTNFIPPDASVASGPTHILGAVNSSFRIWDKQGNVIKSIPGSLWYTSLGLSISGNLSDPKVSYDHFAKRWIITWITPPIGPFAYDVISVSDDSIPLGTWYNFAMRNDLNGSTSSGIWRDYEGVGYDANAIYITGNGFTVSGSNFVYSKIRIINKAQLYSNTAGPVTWFDLWDIRDASNMGTNFGIRPSIIYGNPNEYYFLCNSNSSGTYVSLYKLINPLTNPSMTGVAVPVVQYSSPVPSRQLGTSATITAGGSSAFRCEPVYKNGSLYAVHAVRYNNTYSAFKYYKLNTSTNIADQDITFGADEFYYSYPAISIDKDLNVLVSFSRSALTQYIGAFFTSRSVSDPPNTFNPSSVLQPGRGQYVNTGQSDRWGDYMGTWLDPVNDEEFWIMTEFADLNNLWGVWVGNIRINPFPSARIFASRDTINFGNIEINTNSDTQAVKIVNYGNTTLTISSIQSSGSEFRILNLPSLPLNLNFNDSIQLNILFAPVSTGFKSDSIRIASNDAIKPNIYVNLKAKGFIISPVQANTIYGATGTQSGGSLITINSGTGSGTIIGQSGFSQLNGLSIRPSNNKLYSAITSTPVTRLVRVNAAAGDAYDVSPIPIANIKSIAFDLNDDLYCTSSDGKLYRYVLSSNDTHYIGSTGIANLFGISINPVNRTLWAMSGAGVLYKIDKQTAVAQMIGSTGLSPNTGIAFSKTGILYGINGIGVVTNKLISIDTSTGTATVIGTNTGYAGINAISISPEIVGVQNISTIIPSEFKLHQNYPNPFNPKTKIVYELPLAGEVKMKIYNSLGKEVAMIVNERQNAGTYAVDFNGAEFSSGVYFYKLITNNFTMVKQMVLVK